jgi:hypothetical protein
VKAAARLIRQLRQKAATLTRTATFTVEAAARQ